MFHSVFWFLCTSLRPEIDFLFLLPCLSWPLNLPYGFASPAQTPSLSHDCKPVTPRPAPPHALLPISWEPQNRSSKQGALLEMTTCVVTETTGKKEALLEKILHGKGPAIPPPPLPPPSTFAAADR